MNSNPNRATGQPPLQHNHARYDPIYQLTSVTKGGPTTETYSYDSVGNRLSSLAGSYGYNTSNEMNSSPSATFTYDNNGNTLTKVDSTGTTSYAWDFENRLSSVTLPASGGTVSFKYDPLGRRIQKSSASGFANFLYDGQNLLEEVDGNGNVTARYTQAEKTDEPLAMLRSGTTAFYHADGLGSITSLTGSSGAPLVTYSFDSFGNTVNSTGTLSNPFRYTSREFDSETNLYFYRARYYDSAAGRFLNEDPISFDGGINFYRYVRNNPANFIDPFGQQQDSVTSSLMQAIARGNSAEIEEILKDVGDVLSDRAKDLGRKAIQRLRSKAGDWIAKNCKGSINREFPSQFLDKTIEEIQNLARAGDSTARKALKLLTDSRFMK